MVPYFEAPALHIGLLTIHLFSALVIAAILTARAIIAHRAGRLGFDRGAVSELCVWMLVSGLIAAHVTKVMLSNGPGFMTNPLKALVTAGGIMSLGGLAGGLLGGIVWGRVSRTPVLEMIGMLDLVAYALPFAWILGRLGCFLAHDHRGIYTHNWLGVRFPEGTRFDLGLTELIFLVPFAALFYALGRRPKPIGYFFGLYGICYGLYRVWQDTLHLERGQFHGDTFAGTITCLVGLIGWLIAKNNERRTNNDERSPSSCPAPLIRSTVG